MIRIGVVKCEQKDGKIIDECLNGEPEAFGLLVDKYKASIFALIYSKVQNFHDAQDITQDVFLEAYRDLRKLRHWDSFVWWLYSIAYNNCKNWFRAQSKRPDSNFIEDQEQEKLETPSINAYHENLVNESLRDTLDSLPEKYREVLTLYYLGGMDSVEIARAIGTSPTAVRQRLSRARIQLKKEALVMMGEAFSQQKLQVTFTFRIVEAVKRIKINPVSTMKGLPWGLSLATGIIIAVMSLNPYVSWFSQIGDYARSVLPSETRVLKVGEIPVDVVKTSSIAILADKMGKGKGGEPKKPDVQNSFFLAPQGEGGEWVKKADMPTARCELATSVVNGKIYAIAGFKWGENFSFSATEEYDPLTNTWIRKSDIPTARDGASAAVVDGRIYVMGHWFNSPIVEVYDPETDRWEKKAGMLIGRCYFSASVVNDKIYAIGGYDGNKVLSIVEEYDPKTDTWEKKAGMLIGRCYFSASLVNGKIYAIGGYDGNKVLSIVEEYDPKIDTWTRKADMPAARAFLSSSTVNGKIYVIGGGQSSWDTPWENFSTTVEAYDPEMDKWEKKADMLTARGYLSTCAVNGKIYAIGGSNGFPGQPGAAISTVEEYTPEDGQSVSSSGKLPSKWGKLKSK
jgi:RNA polymerase sigma factor (sigma-70 family)